MSAIVYSPLPCWRTNSVTSHTAWRWPAADCSPTSVAAGEAAPTLAYAPPSPGPAIRTTIDPTESVNELDTYRRAAMTDAPAGRSSTARLELSSHTVPDRASRARQMASRSPSTSAPAPERGWLTAPATTRSPWTTCSRTSVNGGGPGGAGGGSVGAGGSGGGGACAPATAGATTTAAMAASVTTVPHRLGGRSGRWLIDVMCSLPPRPENVTLVEVHARRPGADGERRVEPAHRPRRGYRPSERPMISFMISVVPP